MKLDLIIIKKATDDFFGFNISKKSREAHLVDARRLYFRLARELTNLSLVRIARSMDKNHATAIHMIRTCKDICEVDKEFNAKYLTLREKLENLKNQEYKKTIFNTPRKIHPGRFKKLGYGKTKSFREIFNKGGQAPKQRNEIY